MIYIWLYLGVGAFVIAWMLWWCSKYEGEKFYIADLWKIVLSWMAWPIMSVVWIWFVLDEKYNLNDRLK